MLFRKASIDDISALLSLEKLCFPQDSWGSQALSGQLTDPLCITMIVLVDSVPIGYCTGRLFPPEAEIYRVAIHPSYRRNGIAQTLIGAFFGIAATHNCHAFFLEVRASNTPARALYASLGFNEEGLRHDYYRNPTEDGVLMRCVREVPASC